ncbi:hypothetical protein [Microbulbifer hydrolyticus]|uniref:DUF1631 family protein n=1 Tax=Microbulbifer hydrolyticus TaxID=48074 RepID=A0A6P1TAC5_9GAMM|nr:hypothetical protein [Microbulbifer hydrolyticus]MBB5213323.1 hypothetical protein [Microbulbifer hydrolyticus]QHQ38613.1 hypothetical protein GTQ55_06165 [Microbulbifer hydrolyticus]
MNDLDVLNKIASNLTERKGAAVLSDFDVLVSNIQFVHHALSTATGHLKAGQDSLSESLGHDVEISSPYKAGENLEAFPKIVRSLLGNGRAIIDRVVTETKPDSYESRNRGDFSNIPKKTFNDYSNLLTLSRQLIDSLTADAYQLFLLDPKSFNYHVLVSLNSFNKFATKSLTQALFNSEILSALQEFEQLNYNQWASSHITSCAHTSFGKKVDFLLTSIPNNNVPPSLADDLKNLFKFSSEFAHIGYVSTFFTSAPHAEIVLGSSYGPILPSTENFSELKYEILKTVCDFLSHLYIPAIVSCANKLLNSTQAQSAASELQSASENLIRAIKTRNSTYFFFIKDGLIGSSEIIPLTCMCRTKRQWEPPHHDYELYCKSCGSGFHLMSIQGEGYVFTSAGPIKIIGSKVPDINDMSQEERDRLMQAWAERMSAGTPP